MRDNLNIVLIILVSIFAVLLISKNFKALRSFTIKLFKRICGHNRRKNEKNQLASLLKVFEVKVGNEPVKLSRWGKSNDGGYVIPVIALEKADALIGYGIAGDISFEREFSQRLDKPSFGFDGGVSHIETGDARCHFYSECIGDADHLYPGQEFSGKISSYSDHLKMLQLVDRKIFLKMDIEGSEFNVFDDILKHKDNISGIVLECHIWWGFQKAIDLLTKLSKDFLLLHVHGNNASIEHYFTSQKSIGRIPLVLELTYINKNLVHSYQLSKNQKHPTELDQANCLDHADYQFEILPG